MMRAALGLFVVLLLAACTGTPANYANGVRSFGNIHFALDEERDRLILDPGSSSTEWRNLAVNTTSPPIHVAVERDATNSTADARMLASGELVSLDASGTVENGNFLAFCALGGVREAAWLWIQDSVSGRLLAAAKFKSVAAC